MKILTSTEMLFVNRSCFTNNMLYIIGIPRFLKGKKVKHLRLTYHSSRLSYRIYRKQTIKG